MSPPTPEKKLACVRSSDTRKYPLDNLHGIVQDIPTNHSEGEPMNAAQMLHQRMKAGLTQLLADTTKKRTKAQRAALQARLDEVMAYERAHPEIVA